MEPEDRKSDAEYAEGFWQGVERHLLKAGFTSGQAKEIVHIMAYILPRSVREEADRQADRQASRMDAIIERFHKEAKEYLGTFHQDSEKSLTEFRKDGKEYLAEFRKEGRADRRTIYTVVFGIYAALLATGVTILLKLFHIV